MPVNDLTKKGKKVNYECFVDSSVDGSCTSNILLRFRGVFCGYECMLVVVGGGGGGGGGRQH